MERPKVTQAAELLSQLDTAFNLKKRLDRGAHCLVLHAYNDDDTMYDEVKIQNGKVADSVLHLLITRITDELIALGVTDLGTA